MGRQKIVSFLFILAIPIAANAQDVHEKRDTLPESVVVSDRFVVRDAGTRIVPTPQMRSMVSVTGESDAIKYIQTLPGVPLEQRVPLPYMCVAAISVVM